MSVKWRLLRFSASLITVAFLSVGVNGQGNGNNDNNGNNNDQEDDGTGPPPKRDKKTPKLKDKSKGPKPKVFSEPPPQDVETRPTGPLPQLPTPDTSSLINSSSSLKASVRAAAVTAAVAPKPLRMKFLVISADGKEPTFEAAQKFLDQIGIPFDTVNLTSTAGKLPALSDGTTGFYQGIVLSSGNLATCNSSGVCSIALPAEGWAALDTYTATYSVRTLSYYTWPEARYGITFAGGTTTSGSIAFSTAAAAAGTDTSAATVFSYMNRASTVPLTGAWTYRADPTPAAGEITTPLLTESGKTIAAYHKKADGRESLALTM